MTTLCLPCISVDHASDVWNKRRQGITVSDTDYEVTYTPEHSNSDQRTYSAIQIEQLKQDLEETKLAFSHSDGSSDKKHASDIDAAVAEIVHSSISQLELTPFQLSNGGFWAWLSNVAADGFFWDFIYWRFKKRGKEQDPARKNWGICSIREFHEIYFARSWLMGHKVHEPEAKDPYAFVKKSGTENWRSHILRVEFGWDPEFVKALVDVIEEDNIKSNLMRTKLVPSLRAWISSANFVDLSHDESKKIIRYLVSKELG